ncbi:MAG: hypothetical protein ACLGIC_09640 [Acidimicrobiia bacterium]
MATPEQIDSLEAALTEWMGATNASTLLQLLGSRPRSSDPQQNPLRNIDLITQLHDAMVEHGDHDLADAVLELARHPASRWVPTCTGSTTGG